MNTVGDLLDRCRAAGQGHVFAFWEELDEEAKGRLVAQVSTLDFDQLVQFQGLIASPVAAQACGQFEPPEVFPLQRDQAARERAGRARHVGAERLRAGKVGYVLVAGGQGSRLGFEGPKGKFPVGPVSGRTLFGWHAARIEAARLRYGCVAPWYIMTSATNDAETRAFFEQQEFFGLGQETVYFFTQKMLPALDLKGRILMQAKDALFLAPNGHGGTLEALASSGALADATSRGVETLSYFQVDSPVARPADELFLGLHAMIGAEMSSKVTAKRSPEEKVGVLGRAGGRLGCIEYSDLPDDLCHARTEDGQLLFRAGNIANHMIQVEFVEQLTGGPLQLPWHLARKKMTSLAEDGRAVERDGVKFEAFIFDALGESRQSVTLEVDRVSEFSPVKNATGADSPETCRQDLCRTFAGWIERAGAQLPEPGPDGLCAVEVDPRLAENEAEFLASMPVSPTVCPTGFLYE